MKKKLLIIFQLFILMVSCTSQKFIREDIEWCSFRWNNEPDLVTPRILLLGGSNSLGYYPIVSKLLEGKVNCDNYASSRSLEDPMIYKETKKVMGRYKHKVIHFYEGFHGMHLSKEQYGEGLEKYVRFLIKNKSSDCTLVFSTLTPWPSKEPNEKLDPVKNTIVMERNQVAKAIMKKYNIMVIDAYALMEPELGKYSLSKGDVHFNKKGYTILAERINNQIIEILNL